MTCTLLTALLFLGTWGRHSCWGLRAQGWEEGLWPGRRWVRGNPLYLALRRSRVLRALAACTVLSPLGPAGGFQRPIFGWEN